MNIENYKDYNTKLNISNSQKDLNKLKSHSKELKTNPILSVDKVFISEEAKRLLEDQQVITNHNKDNETDLFEDMLRSFKESSNPRNNPYDSMIKCIQIATRIINGDKVPGKDEQFLMENEPKMYSTAVLLKQQKEKPTKHESLLDDEENEEVNLEGENKIDSVPIEISSIETESNQ